MDDASIRLANRDSFDGYYQGIGRQRYPDLMFIHLLMVYARPRIDLRRALVIGAGDGAEAIAIARLGATVEAVDISPTSVERMTGHFRDDGVAGLCRASVGDQTALDAADDSMDLVVSWSVISYLSPQDGARALGEIHRVLRPGGAFVGLIESTRHSGPTQPGVVPLGPRTYRIPGSSRTKADVVMTYYDEPALRESLSAFDVAALSHRVTQLPPDAAFEVGQWMVCCTKPA